MCPHSWYRPLLRHRWRCGIGKFTWFAIFGCPIFPGGFSFTTDSPKDWRETQFGASVPPTSRLPPLPLEKSASRLALANLTLWGVALPFCARQFGPGFGWELDQSFHPKNFSSICFLFCVLNCVLPGKLWVVLASLALQGVSLPLSCQPPGVCFLFFNFARRNAKCIICFWSRSLMKVWSTTQVVLIKTLFVTSGRKPSTNSFGDFGKCMFFFCAFCVYHSDFSIFAGDFPTERIPHFDHIFSWIFLWLFCHFWLFFWPVLHIFLESMHLLHNTYCCTIVENWF